VYVLHTKMMDLYKPKCVVYVDETLELL